MTTGFALRSATAAFAPVQARGGPGTVASLRVAMERITQRRALARLDDRMLADVGLTREQAEAEIAKPFWQA